MYQEVLGTLMGAAFTLAVWSYLWRENTAYRIAEHIFVACSTAHIVVMNKDFIMKNAVIPISTGQSIWIVALLLGLLFCFYFSKKYFWIYRYPMSLVVALGTGLAVAGAVKAQIVDQITATLKPLVATTPLDTLTNIVIIVGTIGTLSYFYFTKEHRGILGGSARIGRYVLMIAFGAYFGFTVSSWIAFLIGRAMFLIQTYPAYYMLPVGLLLLVVGILRDRGARDK
jgi:hypothetical protein